MKLAVYAYFAAALFGRQTLDVSNGKTILGYEDIGGFFNCVPLFLILEFVFFVGWLKAAEVLINPYGIKLHINTFPDNISFALYCFVYVP